ncbi:hypothetical protein VOLCADRAFT_98260 [Volvox carteri f. nagariensis]|uniref:Uncharacterized protein n=1 Tax=Volvox carteri f. nagariensis TaxID=3068 RepID=D8UEZ7_VOLCA|nr:uncharacterized protein VOLCADRAFT_98260 [Volvox carteri f. nagariensis]EFJ41730.1 hypothetical protein VOLCADRAFT_98260 [Volvox carteri f. nagariensis]|eukprot:XP_002957232.1 hypothetical protein VOLCADRAFT_98260 [Volvox carteri f. nagariensis]
MGAEPRNSEVSFCPVCERKYSAKDAAERRSQLRAASRRRRLCFTAIHLHTISFTPSCHSTSASCPTLANGTKRRCGYPPAGFSGIASWEAEPGAGNRIEDENVRVGSARALARGRPPLLSPERGQPLIETPLVNSGPLAVAAAADGAAAIGPAKNGRPPAKTGELVAEAALLLDAHTGHKSISSVTHDGSAWVLDDGRGPSGLLELLRRTDCKLPSPPPPPATTGRLPEHPVGAGEHSGPAVLAVAVPVVTLVVVKAVVGAGALSRGLVDVSGRRTAALVSHFYLNHQIDGSPLVSQQA